MPDPVKIPQNVYIEDHIVGPLSLRQLIIIMIGGGFSYALYSLIQKAYGSVNIPITILVWLPCAVAAAFALVKINDLSLLRICLLMVERSNKAPVRTWAPRRGISINFKGVAILEEKAATPALSQQTIDTNTQTRIQELSSVVDRALPSRTAPVEETATLPDLPQNEPVPTEPEPSPEDRPVFPVNKNRVAVDGAAANPSLSDLSVFRDVFPPKR